MNTPNADSESAAGSSAPKRAHDVDPCHFASLAAEELQLGDGPEKMRCRGKRWLEEPPRSLFGLALSGGGIRSATFNLGLLQGLHEIGLLRGMDYLASVSGGGYIGGFWSHWRKKHQGKVFPDPIASGQAGAAGSPSYATGDEPPEILHLRRYSKFLAPNVGVFSFDTGRMLVAVLNALVPSLIGATAFLFAAMLASVGIAWLVLVAPGDLARWISILGVLGHMHWGGVVVMLVFGAAHLGAMSYFWKGVDDHKARRVMVSLALLVMLAVIWGWFLSVSETSPEGAREWFRAVGNGYYPNYADPIWKYIFAPAFCLAFVAALNALLRPRDTALGQSKWSTTLRTEGDRASSWLLFGSAAWLVISLLWWAAFFIAANAANLAAAITTFTVAGIPAASLLAFLSRFVSLRPISGERKAERLGRFAIVFASYLTVALLVVASMLGVILVHRHHAWVWLALGTTIALLLTYLRYDPNRIGLHEFYRARIVRCFLGAAETTSNLSKDDLDKGDCDCEISEAANGRAKSGPLHLIVCAANDLTPSDPLASLSRGAASAVLSPVGLSVGDNWVAWATKSDGVAAEPAYRDLPSLGAALTASGAAFNTQMGAKSKSLGAALAFLMTSLGLRLGLWVRNPARLKADERVTRGGSGVAFFSELLGRSDARDGEWVFLSDGGHFDNTALYELVRRHCRYVILSDCGEDADHAYDDLGVAVRRVREDFGVDVRINLEPLKPDERGVSRQAMVAGDIHYPDGDTGILLVFKPSIVGTEPPDVLQYKARNQKFPQQSTADQFFDEAQWESYRRLGQHAVRIAFASVADRERHPTLGGSNTRLNDIKELEVLRDAMAMLFTSARREWFARPVDYAQRVERIARQVSFVDQALSATTPRLTREVLWELTETASTGTHGNTPTLSFEEAAKSLSAIRQALVTFEAIYLSENLATQFNQPMYAGVMNLMARWMRAPLVRAWWPLLRATCTQGFTLFVEAQFELSYAPADLTACSTLAPGVLQLATKYRGEDGARNKVTTVRLVLVIRDTPEPAKAPRSPASQVEVARLDANQLFTPPLLIWMARDLVIPPGLWSTGLGTELLRRMGEHADSDALSFGSVKAREHGQIVLVRTFRSAGANAKKDSADLQQLYIASDFEPVQPGEMMNLYPHNFRKAYESMRTRWKDDEPNLPEYVDDRAWILREYVMLHRRSSAVTQKSNERS